MRKEIVSPAMKGREEKEVSMCKKAQSARLRRLHLRQMKAAGAVADASVKRMREEEDRSMSNSSSESTSPSSVESGLSDHGWVSLIGRRREMEDEVSIEPAFVGREYDFFAVYDGHGGAAVARACRERMHVVLAEEVVEIEEGREEESKWREAMVASFAKVDGEVSAAAADGEEAAERTMGSTAVVAVVGTRRIFVANCGDSRAVLCRGGVAVPLSTDHKPNRPDELERVEAAGGRVINWDGYRILGVLSTSRSIGDYYLKPYVTAEPEITMTERNEKDEFLILASDGLWDVISSEVACRVTRQCLTGQAAKLFPHMVNGQSAAEAANLLAELAMSQGSRDNISIIVVQLSK
ncbi:hypothetical protein IEQ34_018976 [Dendrobium chrysotoxum]|uniref:protein-serine/threonine phosphatase n=1 Tax=Dendrobium chrysotoxum TaxID=161865 RepID=A0AAV7G616_DENCH|nr:hypothetical protein IEQ34_018976 [Dendrobium chrysotoxum]